MERRLRPNVRPDGPLGEGAASPPPHLPRRRTRGEEERRERERRRTMARRAAGALAGAFLCVLLPRIRAGHSSSPDVESLADGDRRVSLNLERRRRRRAERFDIDSSSDAVEPSCGDGACDVAEDAASCPSDCASRSIATATVGGNKGSVGYVFSVRARRDIVVTSLDVYTKSQRRGELIQVYARRGGYGNYESTEEGWELVYEDDDADLNGRRSPTTLGGLSVPVPAGAVQSFYVYAPNKIRYIKGNGDAEVARADGTMEVLQGVGLKNKFSGSSEEDAFPLREFTGAIGYDVRPTAKTDDLSDHIDDSDMPIDPRSTPATSGPTDNPSGHPTTNPTSTPTSTPTSSPTQSPMPAGTVQSVPTDEQDLLWLADWDTLTCMLGEAGEGKYETMDACCDKNFFFHPRVVEKCMSESTGAEDAATSATASTSSPTDASVAHVTSSPPTDAPATGPASTPVTEGPMTGPTAGPSRPPSEEGDDPEDDPETVGPTRTPTSSPVSGPSTKAPTTKPVTEPPTKGPTSNPVADPPTKEPTS
ncbi:hypothetical protein ACHAWF_001487, partial [Thalassiosira exigua]